MGITLPFFRCIVFIHINTLTLAYCRKTLVIIVFFKHLYPLFPPELLSYMSALLLCFLFCSWGSDINLQSQPSLEWFVNEVYKQRCFDWHMLTLLRETAVWPSILLYAVFEAIYVLPASVIFYLCDPYSKYFVQTIISECIYQDSSKRHSYKL